MWLHFWALRLVPLFSASSLLPSCDLRLCLVYPETGCESFRRVGTGMASGSPKRNDAREPQPRASALQTDRLGLIPGSAARELCDRG